MKLYADPITVNCRKVMAGFALMDIPYEHHHVDYFKSEQKTEAYLSVNPNAALPAMQDGDFVLWESNAMLQYAADQHGRELHYPHHPQTRADINRWLFWESASWFPTCYAFLVEHCVKPLFQQPPDAAVLDAQSVQFHKLAAILDRRLAESRWVCGEGPTIADIALAAPLHLHPYQKLPIADHPNVRRWMVEQIETLPCWEATWVGEGFTLTRPEAATL